MRKFKSLIVLCLVVICLVGCNKVSDKDILKELKNKIEKSTGYEFNGELEMINNEDSYTYDVNVAYMPSDYYRVSLKNKINNHEQIILKNKDGVYVLTPSLKKSYKFQSEWPYNNSQIYLLQTILKDIEDDKEHIFSEIEDGYLFTTRVNYLSNKDLVKQNIYFDKDKNIKKVDVMTGDDQVKMRMTFNNIDMKKNFTEDYFKLDQNMALSSETIKPVTKIDNIIYPMYMPNNTHLDDQETVKTENGERAILTFSGDKTFTLVEETIKLSDDNQVLNVIGEPCMLQSVVGVVNDYSVNWQNNGIDYYLMSNDLSKDELVNIALSVSSQPVSKIIK